MDRVEEALAMPQSEPAGLVTACLLAEGLSPEETAGRLGMSRATVYRRLERWPKQIGETQPELAARFGGDR
jgi:transposase